MLDSKIDRDELVIEISEFLDNHENIIYKPGKKVDNSSEIPGVQTYLATWLETDQAVFQRLHQHDLNLCIDVMQECLSHKDGTELSEEEIITLMEDIKDAVLIKNRSSGADGGSPDSTEASSVYYVLGGSRDTSFELSLAGGDGSGGDGGGE